MTKELYLSLSKQYGDRPNPLRADFFEKMPAEVSEEQREHIESLLKTQNIEKDGRIFISILLHYLRKELTTDDQKEVDDLKNSQRASQMTSKHVTNLEEALEAETKKSKQLSGEADLTLETKQPMYTAPLSKPMTPKEPSIK